MNVGESDKSDAVEFGESSSDAWDRLHPGEVPPDVIKRIAEDLKGAAHLCSELSMQGKDSIMEPSAVKAVGDLVRQAAIRLRDELAAADSRKRKGEEQSTVVRICSPERQGY
ncbi:MAG TPA: hypothetical protein VNC39_12720 [Acidocella sp.]|uniref:hypothetical protein n=1 Tax=Acidocella sp. TaxID=50710 RepID=UPI002CD2E66E|nr:hypothetical protein [Acidocella sp.]HVE22830.1 hypothetical protein [Acidocella sp.]